MPSVSVDPDILLRIIENYLDRHSATYPNVKFSSLDQLKQHDPPDGPLPICVLAILTMTRSTLTTWVARMEDAERASSMRASLVEIAEIARQ